MVSGVIIIYISLSMSDHYLSNITYLFRDNLFYFEQLTMTYELDN